MDETEREKVETTFENNKMFVGFKQNDYLIDFISDSGGRTLELNVFSTNLTCHPDDRISSQLEIKGHLRGLREALERGISEASGDSMQLADFNKPLRHKDSSITEVFENGSPLQSLCNDPALEKELGPKKSRIKDLTLGLAAYAKDSLSR